MASGREEEEREVGGSMGSFIIIVLHCIIRDRSSYKFLDKKETSVLPAKCGWVCLKLLAKLVPILLRCLAVCVCVCVCVCLRVCVRVWWFKLM